MNIEHCRFSISRYDGYYDSINNKANVFLAINIFLIGGLFASLALLPNYLNIYSGAAFWILIMLALNIASTLFTLIAIIPYSKTDGNSLVYFGDIAEMKPSTFLKKFSAQQESELCEDLKKQIFYLAKGLGKKFKNLRIAGQLLFIEAIILIPLIICVTKNLK
jgi:hypothetical protein